MRHTIISTIISILALSSCSVGGIGDRAVVTDNRITISNIYNLPGEAAVIKAVLRNGDGEHVELVSADIDDGVAVLYMPMEVDSRDLRSLREAIDKKYSSTVREGHTIEIELSDEDVNFAFIDFDVHDSAGWRISNIQLESSSVQTDLIYADRACTVEGRAVGYDGQEDVYNLRLVKGYNWTKYIGTDWLSGIPSGAAWHYYYVP